VIVSQLRARSLLTTDPALGFPLGVPTGNADYTIAFAAKFAAEVRTRLLTLIRPDSRLLPAFAQNVDDAYGGVLGWGRFATRQCNAVSRRYDPATKRFTMVRSPCLCPFLSPPTDRRHEPCAIRAWATAPA
jgi:hypothetical protein